MIRSIVFASLVFTGLCTNPFQNSKNRLIPTRETASFDALIIGAGWAGLGAGNALLSEGITNFQILEARDVIGGRSKTIYEFGENLPLDLGSEWVLSNNPVYDVVVDNNIPNIEEEFNFDVYRPNGEKINRLVASALVGGYFASFNLYQIFRQKTDNSDKALQKVMDDFKFFLPIGDCGKIFFDAFIDLYIEIEAAADPSDMSLKYHNSNEPHLGSDVFMGVPNGGYKSIVDKYAESLLPKIKLESKVTKVDYSTIPINVTYEDTNGTVTFVQANKVFVTLPIGVLRRGMSLFNSLLTNLSKRI